MLRLPASRLVGKRPSKWMLQVRDKLRWVGSRAVTTISLHFITGETTNTLNNVTQNIDSEDFDDVESSLTAAAGKKNE